MSSYEILEPEEGIEPPEERETSRGAQLVLSETELKLLATQIDTDKQNADADHETRKARNKIFYELWRSRVAPLVAADGTKGEANFKVPLTKWQLMGKCAKEADALLGDDMQVVAVPVGPTDQAQVAKVGLWQTWRVKNDMKIVTPLIEFLFNKNCYGRAFAKLPYDIETYTQGGKEIIWREGPKFIPIDNDYFITPAERVKNLHEFSWVIYEYSITLDDLLEGEAAGKYVGITDNWADIFRAAKDTATEASDGTHPVQDSKDALEGVNRQDSQSMGEFVKVYEYYGYWRMLADPETDAQIDDFDNREKKRTEIVACYLPHCNRIISVQKLEDLYPGMPLRRPFVESSLQKTGDYWGMGLPEMLMDIETELTVNNNNTTEAGEVSTGPMLAVRPTAAQKVKQTKWEPRMILEVDDPERDVRLLNFDVDMTYTVTQEQRLRGYAELVTGISDQALGRSPDRPNAPKTARGQILLDENNNIRLSLDMLGLREDFKLILQRIWLLDSQYAPDDMFFRVTEEQAKGLFDTEKGFGKLTPEERGGRFDFDIQFATSVYSREVEKQREMELAQIALSTQLVAMNPQATWNVLNSLYKSFGKEDFKMIVPKPPDIDMPYEPDEEWARALQGLDLHVHALDQDILHLQQHKQQLAEQMAKPESRRDKDAINRMIAHSFEHEQQKQKKLEMAAQTAAQMAAMQAAGINPEQIMGGQQMPPQGQQMPQAAGLQQ
jgi:hypothetical protein